MFLKQIIRQTLQKERQARELAEKEKNDLLERLNKLEEEATKAREGLLASGILKNAIKLIYVFL